MLAALYESWLLPLAIVLIVPMCLLCAVAGLLVTFLDLNIFSQIGLVVLVGLATKNAILIVEFAKQKREAGMTRHEAAVEAAHPAAAADPDDELRVHPRRGPAADRRPGPGPRCGKALGTAVFSGMLGVTVFGIFFTPVFYSVIERFRSRNDRVSAPPTQ